MISGLEILKRIKSGDIVISDFDENRLNPNSYNVRLGENLKVYDFQCNPLDPLKIVLEGKELDPKKENKTRNIKIGEEGYILMPGILYLGETEEYTETHNLVPKIDGRSTYGRLGIKIHATAGFGDVGFKGKWTLEIEVAHPVRVYPGMQIGQIYYEEITGDIDEYNGYYQNQDGVTAAKVHKTI